MNEWDKSFEAYKRNRKQVARRVAEHFREQSTELVAKVTVGGRRLEGIEALPKELCRHLDYGDRGPTVTVRIGERVFVARFEEV